MANQGRHRRHRGMLDEVPRRDSWETRLTNNCPLRRTLARPFNPR
jgi:hypothetical protein